MTVIKTIEQLKDLANTAKHSGCECYIQLKGGLRSSKFITYNAERNLFTILNEIDGSVNKLNQEQLASETNIIEAMNHGALIKY